MIKIKVGDKIYKATLIRANGKKEGKVEIEVKKLEVTKVFEKCFYDEIGDRHHVEKIEKVNRPSYNNWWNELYNYFTYSKDARLAKEIMKKHIEKCIQNKIKEIKNLAKSLGKMEEEN